MLYQLARKAGVPAWVFEGYPIDQPPIEWLVRYVEFTRLEASVTVRSHT